MLATLIILTIHIINSGTQGPEDSVNNIVESKDTSKVYYVSSKEELLLALSNSKDTTTIIIHDRAIINLTGERNIIVGSNTTLRSGNKSGRSIEGLIISDTDGTGPLFAVKGTNVIIDGLRIKGSNLNIFFDESDTSQNRKIERDSLIRVNKTDFYKRKMYEKPVSTGIEITGSNVLIKNCEIFGWTQAGIAVEKNTTNVKIIENYLHHNQHFGLGYGIYIDRSFVDIHNNVFDYNGHSITGTGRIGTGYCVSNNIFKENHLRAWPIDMHGGKDRDENNDIAGSKFVIHENTFFLYPGKRAIVIRGKPISESVISKNVFCIKIDPASKQQWFNYSKTYGIKLDTEASMSFDYVIQQYFQRGNINCIGNKIRFKKQ